jgi:HSP20 family protein
MSSTTEAVRTEQAAPSTVKAQAPVLTPAVDIFEDAAGITLLADLPGVSKERLSIKVESNRLFIEGVAAIPAPAGVKVFHTELRESIYRRAFTLGRELDRASIQANLKDGVLTLRVPRLQEAQPRQIEITTA